MSFSSAKFDDDICGVDVRELLSSDEELSSAELSDWLSSNSMSSSSSLTSCRLLPPNPSNITSTNARNTAIEKIHLMNQNVLSFTLNLIMNDDRRCWLFFLLITIIIITIIIVHFESKIRASKTSVDHWKTIAHFFLIVDTKQDTLSTITIDLYKQ